MAIDRLKISDIDRLISYIELSSRDPVLLAELSHFQKIRFNKEGHYEERPLTENEIKRLGSNRTIKFYLILLFLAENIALESLRIKNRTYDGDVVLVNDLWEEMEEMLVKKLFLSREISSYFIKLGGKNSPEFQKFISLAKFIKIENLSSEEFTCSADKKATCSLYLTGKYVLEETNPKLKTKNDNTSLREKYDLYDRKTCCHVFLYDPFKFEEPQSYVAYRYINKCATKKNIESIYTVIDSKPELTVLLDNGSFTKVAAEDISDFLEKQLFAGELDKTIVQHIKNDYPPLFYPPLTIELTKTIYQNLYKLINKGMKQSEEKAKPLLLILAEIHDSKNSFLLQVIVLLIAKKLGVEWLFHETINLHHKEHGFDAPVNATNSLLSFAQTNLCIQVKDLEAKLHYGDIEAPYPYHEIPEEEFGIDAREQSWIIDIKTLGKGAVLILGAEHLNNIVNSELKNNFTIVPINCTCDKKYSDKLSITNHNFIALEYNLNQLTLDEIINMALEAQISQST
ncbi:hypothetical protein [Legionella rowbothamii]|uniref:hypothetical protein n=1 Tax=Legionella rowbothamii TaxID=96229 RepID=UPI0010553D5F|nr:hypothetical protein [Legionella rowbothamii]